MSTQQTLKTKRSVSIRTVLLIVFVVILTVFVVQNWTYVDVWPFGKQKLLAVVIGVSFVLGGLIGWLGHSILFGRRGLAPDRTVIQDDDR